MRYHLNRYLQSVFITFVVAVAKRPRNVKFISISKLMILNLLLSHFPRMSANVRFSQKGKSQVLKIHLYQVRVWNKLDLFLSWHQNINY